MPRKSKRKILVDGREVETTEYIRLKNRKESAGREERERGRKAQERTVVDCVAPLLYKPCPRSQERSGDIDSGVICEARCVANPFANVLHASRSLSSEGLRSKGGEDASVGLTVARTRKEARKMKEEEVYEMWRWRSNGEEEVQRRSPSVLHRTLHVEALEESCSEN